jgi:predicted transcriptional regulator
MKTLTTSRSVHRKITPLSLRIDDAKKDQLVWIAQKQDRSVHYLLLQAVSEYISKETKRIEFYEAALEASQHYAETGLHTTHEEVMVWVNSLGTPNEFQPPVCHK